MKQRRLLVVTSIGGGIEQNGGSGRGGGDRDGTCLDEQERGKGNEQEGGQETGKIRSGQGQDQGAEGGSFQRPGMGQSSHSFVAPSMEASWAASQDAWPAAASQEPIQTAPPPNTNTWDQQQQHQQQGQKKNALPLQGDKEDSVGGGDNAADGVSSLAISTEGDYFKSRTVNDPLLGIQAIQHKQQSSNSHQAPVRQNSLILHSQPGPSTNVGRLNPTRHSTDVVDNRVNRKLEEFVEYFVKKFEAKLLAYHMILEGELKKVGKFSDKFSNLIGKAIGGGFGSLLASFLGIDAFSGFKIGAEFGEHTVGALICELGESHHRNKVISLSELVYYCKRNNEDVRRILVEAGFDIFQSFEMQFMRVTTDQGHEGALRKLAEDATNRAISYHIQNENCFIAESVILGKSKKESILGIPSHILTCYLKTPKLEIRYEDEAFNKKWNTTSLYEKVGLIIEGIHHNQTSSYYEKHYGKCKTKKYGYRRRFTSELEGWEELKEQYTKISNSLKILQFTDYQYILDPKCLNQKVEGILENINRNDKGLGEERIKTTIGEVKDEIIELINALIKESHEYANDRRILADITTNLKNLKVDEYLQKFEQYFEEAKQERQEIKEIVQQGFQDGSKERQEIADKEQAKLEIMHQDLLSTKQIKDIGPIWFDVRESLPSFIALSPGRQDTLNKVARKIEKGIVVISGLGGVGKSELAIKFARDHSADYEDNVVWINAESYQTLAESFLRLAQDKLEIYVKGKDVNQNDIKPIVDNVYGFFSKRKSLFIFDNADKFKSQDDGDVGICNYLPSLPPNANKPYILITSRNQHWEDIEVILLDMFTEKEGACIVRAALTIQEDSQNDEIQTLIETLQFFPLALQQAVAYIKKNHYAAKNTGSKFEISDYLKRYDEEAKKLLDFKFPSDSRDLYTKTTFTTWKITIDKIRENTECGKEAGDILDIIAYFAPDNIPVQMFLRSELIGGDEEKVGHAVQLLKKYSIVNSGQEQTVVNIHRLVQQVTRIELEKHGKKEGIIRNAFRLLEERFHSFKSTLEDYSKKTEFLPHLEVFLSHIDNWVAKSPNDKEKIKEDYLDTLLIWMSYGYSDLGDPKTTKKLLERSLEIQERHYGSDHFDVARTLVNLSNAYLGESQKQKQLLKRAFEILDTHNESDNFEVALTLMNLGNAYGELGYPQKQEELLERVLEIQEKYYVSDYFEVARAVTNLGNAYGALGNPHKKKDLLEWALVIQETHYGPDNFEVARILVNLGSTYGALGDPQLHKDCLERAAGIQEEHYGPDHLEVGRTLENLGIVYGALGAPQQQKELIKRALKIQEKHYGSDAFDAAETLVNLSKAYLGDSQKQKELLKRALEILDKHCGSDNFEVALSLMNLGNAFGDLGDPQKEKELFKRALEIQEKHYGSDHLEAARTLVNLGNSYGTLGDPHIKKDLLKRALAIQEKYYGPDHFEVARTLVHLGNAYGALGDPHKKKDLLEWALVIQEIHYGPDHFEVARILVNLGSTYGTLGDPQLHKDFLERAAGIQEEHYGPDHLEVGRTLENLGIVYGVLGDLQKQKEVIERGLEIQNKHFTE